MPSRITLRRATMGHAQLLLEWRNDPVTRSFSHTTHVISLGEHEQWLKRVLNDCSIRLYVAYENETPAGMVRAELCGDFWKLSWTVSPEMRGRGIGKRMVALVANEIKEPIGAEIKAVNTASIRIAEYVGMKFDYEKNGVMYYRRRNEANRQNR